MKFWPTLPLLLALLPWAALAEVPDENSAAARKLAHQAEQELRGNILPFWLKHARNEANGSFHAFIGEDMLVRDDQPRGSLLTSRILWTFSAAYRRFSDPAYLEMARYAYRDLTERYVDREHGGVIWTIRPDGRPLDQGKLLYAQAFAIYALSEYYQATGEKDALAQAVAIYSLMERHGYDREHGGYFDALDRGWHPLTRAGSNILGPAPKTQNSHIHILEAFTNLLRVWPDAGLRQRQRELISLMLTRIIDPRTHHLVLYLQPDWTPVGQEISYGHDIELSWLIVEAADVLSDPELQAQARQVALAIADVTARQGIDQDGGVFREGAPAGPTDLAKEWWEQAEATVGFVNAWQLSREPRFFEQAARSWDFIQTRVVDHQNGDWHNTLNRDGTPVQSYLNPRGQSIPSAKLSIWKCPYHNARACLELMARLAAPAH